MMIIGQTAVNPTQFSSINAASSSTSNNNNELEGSLGISNVYESFRNMKIDVKRVRDWDSDQHNNKRPTKKEEEMSTSTSTSTSNDYPTLLMEPTYDRNHCCRVKVRFPDGRRISRSFLYTSSLKQLFAFCYSQLQNVDVHRVFRLGVTIPGATQYLNYNNIAADLTFANSGLTNSMVSLIWD
ncbi:hypothetical protein ACFE04_002224 [Oxalis oulophora]